MDHLLGAHLPPGERVLERLRAMGPELDEKIKRLGHSPERAMGESRESFLLRHKEYERTRGDLSWQKETVRRAINRFGPFKPANGEPFVRDTMDVLQSLDRLYRQRTVAAKNIGEVALTAGDESINVAENMQAVGIGGAFAKSEVELIGRICAQLRDEANSPPLATDLEQ